MAQGPSDTILVAIQITLRIQESKVRNPDPPDRRRFVLSEHIISCYLSIMLIWVTYGVNMTKQYGALPDENQMKFTWYLCGIHLAIHHITSVICNPYGVNMTEVIWRIGR